MLSKKLHGEGKQHLAFTIPIFEPVAAAVLPPRDVGVVARVRDVS